METTMTIVTAQLTVSLDGFLAGPNARPGNPLGDNGEQLHDWVVRLDSWREGHGMEGGVHTEESDLLSAHTASIGAHIMGRNMFDEGEEPWGSNPPFHTPVFVLTSRPREALQREGGTTYYFVTDGIHSALEQAKAAAGGKNVDIAGGANAFVQFLDAGLLDEFILHTAPVFLGAGVRLFDAVKATDAKLEPVHVLGGPLATHVTYRVQK
jgi:dihydrofolate reductase